MAQEITGWVVQRGVTHLFQRKALPWVLYAARDRAAPPDERDFHVLTGVEMPAMLHRVQQNFPECGNDVFPIMLRNARVSRTAKKLHQPICGADVAASDQMHPFRRPR